MMDAMTSRSSEDRPAEEVCRCETSPMMIEQLFHYYYSRAPFPDSPAAHSNIAELMRENLIEPPHSGSKELYRLTARGEAYVNALLNLPLPQRK